MERVHTLINKLQDQVAQSVSKEQMLYTAQLLVAELSTESVVSEQKVSVLMPTSFNQSPNEASIIRVEIEEPKPKVAEKIEEVNKEIDTHNLNKDELANLNISKSETPEIKTKISIEEKKLVIEKRVVYELNDTVVHDLPSINDKLKEEVLEVANSIKDTPVKDLRKAIGINDKYAFINELFGKDESTYERSIKAINNFEEYKVAETWINKELKTKLFWEEESATVQNFYAVVKRRFSEI